MSTSTLARIGDLVVRAGVPYAVGGGVGRRGAARRAELHAAAARAIEQLHADKLDDRAALLAYHWEQAGEALTAAKWCARAGGVAELDSPADALRHWEKVRTLLAPIARSEESVELRLRAASQLLVFGFRQGMSSERVDEIFAEGKALAVSLGNVREQVRMPRSTL